MSSNEDDTPLKVALRSGAEIGLARAIANHGDESTVGSFIQARLSNLGQDDLTYILNLARNILNAGDYLDALTPDERQDPSRVPTNPELFQDKPSNDRVRWFGQWTIPGSGKWWDFGGTFPDLPTDAELVQYAADLASSYIEQYPTRFLGALTDDPGTVTVRILGQEKAF